MNTSLSRGAAIKDFRLSFPVVSDRVLVELLRRNQLIMPLVDDLHLLALERQFEKGDHAVFGELCGNRAATHAGEFLLDPPDVSREMRGDASRRG